MGWRNFAFLLCLFGLGITGCRSGPPYSKWDSPQTPLPLEVAPGGVTVDLMAQHKPLLPFLTPSQQYWNFTMQLNTGVLNLDTWDTFTSPDQVRYSVLEAPAGAVKDCTKPTVATSPNAAMNVRCEEQNDAKGKLLQNTFVVTDATTHSEILRKQLDPSRIIHGYAWSPNSQAVAILSSSQEFNTDYLGIPERWKRLVQYPSLTYYLTVCNVKTGEWREYTIRRDVPEKGFGRIVRWVE